MKDTGSNTDLNSLANKFREFINEFQIAHYPQELQKAFDFITKGENGSYTFPVHSPGFWGISINIKDGVVTFSASAQTDIATRTLQEEVDTFCFG